MADDKKKKKKPVSTNNPLEVIKSLGGSVGQSLKEDLLKPGSADIFKQIMGQAPRKFSGELRPGESANTEDIMSGQHAENLKLQRQLAFERRLRQEEKTEVQRKTNDLRVQLHAVIQEVQALAKSTSKLSTEVATAAMQAPVNPGIYHIVFFEKLLEFVKSFKKKIDEASTWLEATNKKSSKGYWAKYKKHGAKFLLSSEHYLTRSAG